MIFIYLILVLGIGSNTVTTKPSENVVYNISKKTRTIDANKNNIVVKKTNPIKKSSDSLASYTTEKATIKLLRQQLIEDLYHQKISMDDVKKSFSNHLVNRLIPHWYGTEWSFGGHTAIPNQGKIACGYFISTTLRDMGLRLNRYRLAQKSPIDEAKMISCGAEIKTINAKDPASGIKKIDALTKEGISFIGFDKGHVGFLLKKDKKLFLVHSNYLSPNSVCLEPIETSNVFKQFSVFHLVDISNNDQLMQRWLNNLEIL